MKFTHLLILFSCIFSKAWTQDTYPIQSFSRVHYYKLKSGFERPKPDNGILLTTEQTKQLCEMINNPSTYETPEFRCFDAYDVFIFYNDRNQKVARLDLGFKCRKVLAEPLIPVALETGLGLTDDASIALQTLVREISEDLSYTIPDDVTQMTHAVKAGETWEAIAKKYDTSVDLIASINKKNLAWTPTEGDSLVVCLHYAYLPYPTIDIASTPSEPVKPVATTPKPVVVKTNTHNPKLVETPVRPTKTATNPVKESEIVADSENPPSSPPSNPAIKDIEVEVEESSDAVVETPAPAPQATSIKHLVQQGDTLYSIARKYNKKLNDILKANGMETPNIKIGQEIIIP